MVTKLNFILFPIGFLTSACIFSACSTATLSKFGRQVEVVSTKDVIGCSEIEKFEGEGSKNAFEFVSDLTVVSRAISDAMNEAGKKGATHLVLGSGKMIRGKDSLDVRIHAISYQCNKPHRANESNLISIKESTSNEPSVLKTAFTQCEKIGVYRGGADQPLFKVLPEYELQKTAMSELMKEVRKSPATHLEKGFIYTIGNAYVFQFGVAYNCPSIENGNL